MASSFSKGTHRQRPPTKSKANPEKHDHESQDWLDVICERTTVLCSVPARLPKGAFDPDAQTNHQQDILDHVFDGIERTLSVRLEQEAAQEQLRRQRQQKAGKKDERSTMSGSTSLNDDLNSIIIRGPPTVSERADGEKDALDYIFDSVESMTCGEGTSELDVTSSSRSRNGIHQAGGRKHGNGKDLLTRQDMESRGVRFRDSDSLVTPDHSNLTPYYVRYFFPKDSDSNRRLAVMILAGVVALVLILTGIILLAK